MEASSIIMLAALVATAILCVPLVHKLKIAQLVRASGVPRRSDLNRTVHDLVGLAEIRERANVVSMAESASRMKDPLLVRGVTLALEGENSQEIRNTLEGSYLNMDATACSGPVETVRSLLTIVCFVLAFGGTTSMLMSSIQGEAISPLAGLFLAAAIFAGIMSSLMSRADWTAAASARQSEILRRLIVVEGVISLAEGLDASAMRRRLTHLLPGQVEAPEVVVRKAA